jgi:hypothetical protein
MNEYKPRNYAGGVGSTYRSIIDNGLNQIVKDDKKSAESDTKVEITDISTLSDKVAATFTSLRLTSFQEYDYIVDHTASGLNVQNVEDIEGNGHPERNILELAKLLYKTGIQRELLPGTSKELGQLPGTLLLTLMKTDDKWKVSGGGNISDDFGGRINNIYLDIILPEESLARDLFTAIKQTPNTILDKVIYRILEPENQGQYLPMARERETGTSRIKINPFVKPITRVLAAEIQ